MTASRSRRRSKASRFPATSRAALQTMALGFAVGTRGADHNRSGAYEVDFSDKVDRRHATARCGAAMPSKPKTRPRSWTR